MLTPEQEKELCTKLFNSISDVRKLLEVIPEHKRIELLDLISDGYCTSCGSKHIDCNCDVCNDELEDRH